MSILFIDCAMGAAGDMLTAALLELLPDPDSFMEKINRMGLKGICYKAMPSEKNGILGTHVRVLVNGKSEEELMHSHAGDSNPAHDHHNHEHSHADSVHSDAHHEHTHDHPHRSLNDLESIISVLSIEENVKKDILSVYRLIAEAESHVHGVPVTEIHFHEVGNLDAVADVAAVCMLIREIAPDRIVCSPIHVGSGMVRCAHGVLPVPAPATAYILKDIPIYSGSIKGELCTPTGAALLKYFADEFSAMPLMKVQKIGYGMGTKNFDTANCVRALLGEDASASSDCVYQLSCNIDDMTGEEIGFAVGRLIDLGARDVFTESVMMKKNRPGILLNVICGMDEREKFVKAIFANTSTIGIRESRFDRYVLKRREESIRTQFGEVRKKVSEGYGAVKEKFEYEDLARIAENEGLSVSEVREKIRQ